MLSLHPLRNKLFETWVVSEFIKTRWSQGRYDDLYFWRDNFGTEVELMLDVNGQLQPIGIRAGATPHDEWLIPLKQWRRYAGLYGLPAEIIYGGNKTEPHSTHGKTQCDTPSLRKTLRKVIHRIRISNSSDLR